MHPLYLLAAIALLCSSVLAASTDLSTCGDVSSYPTGSCNQLSQCSLSVVSTSLVLDLDAARANAGIQAYPENTECGNGLSWQGISVNAITANIGNPCQLAGGSWTITHWFLNPPQWVSNGAYFDAGTGYQAVAPAPLTARSHEFWIRGDKAVLSLQASSYLFYTGDSGTGTLLKWVNITEMHIVEQFAGTVVAETTFAGSMWDNGWMHLVFTYSNWTGSAYNYKIYLNRVLYVSTTITQSYPAGVVVGYGSDKNAAVTWGELRSYNKELASTDVANNYDATVHRYNHPGATPATCMGCALNQRALNNGTCVCDSGYRLNGTSSSCVACSDRKGGNRAFVCDRITGLYPCSAGYVENAYGICIPVSSSTAVSTCSDQSMYPSGQCDSTSQCSVAVATRNLVLELDPARANGGQAYSESLPCAQGLTWTDTSVSALNASITSTLCASAQQPHWHLNPPYWRAGGEISAVTTGWSYAKPRNGGARTLEWWFRGNAISFDGSYDWVVQLAPAWGIILYAPYYPNTNFCLISRVSGSDTGHVCLAKAALFDNKWHHVVLSYTSNTPASGEGYPMVSAYIDGTLFQRNGLGVNFTDESDSYFKMSVVPLDWGLVRVYTRELTASEAANNYAATVQRFRPSLATACAGCSGPGQRTNNNGTACVCVAGYYSNGTSTCAACSDRKGANRALVCDSVTGLYPCSAGYFQNAYGVCISTSSSNAAGSTCSDPSMYPSGQCDSTSQCSVAVATNMLVLGLDAARASAGALAYPDPTVCGNGLTWQDSSASNLSVVVSGNACVLSPGSRWRVDTSVYWSSHTEQLTIDSVSWSAVAPLGDSVRTFSMWFRVNVTSLVSRNQTAALFDSGAQTDGPGRRFALFINAPSLTNVYLFIGVDGVASTMPIIRSTMTTPVAILDGVAWTHVAVTVGAFDGSTPIAWYLNGQLIAASDAVNPQQAPVHLLTVPSRLVINGRYNPIFLHDSFSLPQNYVLYSTHTIGVLFRVSTAANVTGIHYFKGDIGTRSITVQLYTAADSVLIGGTGPITAESGSEWKVISFPSVGIVPGTDYIISYIFDRGIVTYNVAGTPGFDANSKGSIVTLVTGVFSDPGGTDCPHTVNGNWYLVEPVVVALVQATPLALDLGEFRAYKRQLSASDVANNYAATVHRYKPSLATTCPGCTGLNQRSNNNGTACVCLAGYYSSNGSTCATCSDRKGGNRALVCDPITGLYPCSVGYTENAYGICVPVASSSAVSTCSDQSMYPSGQCDSTSQCSVAVATRNLVLELDPARANGGQAYSDSLPCTQGLAWTDTSLDTFTANITSALCASAPMPHWYLNPPYWKTGGEYVSITSGWPSVGPRDGTARTLEWWFRGNATAIPDGTYNFAFQIGDVSGITFYSPAGGGFCFICRMQGVDTGYVCLDKVSSLNNQWHHAVWSYTSDTPASGEGFPVLSAYVDGTLFARTVLNRRFVDSQYSFHLGNAPLDWGLVRIYTRELTASEAVNNYAALLHRFQPSLATTCPGCTLGGQQALNNGTCACLGGLYQRNDGHGCSYCPPGYSNTSSSCVACAAGTYSLGLALSPQCTSCAAPSDPNTHCLANNGILVCNAGMTVDPSTGLCNCAPGFWGSSCTKCADKDQQPLYTHCVDGVNGTGSYVCDSPLLKGTTGMCECPSNSIGFGHYCNQTCSNCPAASAVCMATVNNTAASCVCRTNFYRQMGMNSSDCNCNSGVFGANCTLACSSTCFSRQFGQCDDGYLGTGACTCGTHRILNTNGVCDCPSTGEEGYHCDQCLPGSANSNRSAASCQVCQPGTFAAAAGQATCLACPSGSVTNSANSTSCQLCPLGQYSINATTCVPCAAGSFASSVGIGSCVPCSPGSFAPSSGASTCVACAEATSTPNSGSTGCTACVSPLGTNPGDTGRSSCYGCQPGKALGSQGLCLNCSNGLFSNVSGLTQCMTCSTGQFTPNDGLSYPSCIACSPGQFTGTTASSACLDCATGTYADSAGSSLCMSCSSGTIAPSTGTPTCTPCSAGMHKLTNTSCTSCLAGTASLGGQDVCGACQPGTFATGIESHVCSPCAEGYFNNVTAATNCTACPTNFTTNAIVGTTACVPLSLAVIIHTIPLPYSANLDRISVANATVEIQSGARFEFTVKIAGSLFSIVNVDGFMGQLAYEVALASNTTASRVVITSMRAGSIITQLSIPLTSAQIFQSLVFSNYAFNSTTYPLLGASTQIVALDLAGLLDPNFVIDKYRSNCTERVPFPGRTDLCRSFGACRRGMCVCGSVDSDSYCRTHNLSLGYTSAPNVVCVQNGGNPDVCESQYTTNSSIDYLAADDCRLKHPKYRNVFPLRRYCQNIDYTMGNDAFTALAVFGRVPSMPCDGCDGLEPFWVYTLSFPSVPTRNLTSGFELQQYAYVSNLYDGVQPIRNKRWAWIESRYMYNTNTYQLSRLVFLPGVEGDAQWYFGNNRWNFVDCGTGEYAASAFQCVCQLYYVRHPLTSLCTHGCNNGMVGSECNIATQDMLGCQRVFNVFTSFISYDCSTVVCQNWAYEKMGVCVPIMSQSPDFVFAQLTTSAVVSPALWLIVLGSFLIVAGTTALMTLLRRYWKKRRASREQYTKVASAAPL